MTKQKARLTSSFISGKLKGSTGSGVGDGGEALLESPGRQSSDSLCSDPFRRRRLPAPTTSPIRQHEARTKITATSPQVQFAGELSSYVPWFSPPITKSVEGDSAGDALVGAFEGKDVGKSEAAKDGTKLGAAEGAAISNEGATDGLILVVGCWLGLLDRDLAEGCDEEVGATDGKCEGNTDVIALGWIDGTRLGSIEGAALGWIDETRLGSIEGATLGLLEGAALGKTVGARELGDADGGKDGDDEGI